MKYAILVADGMADQPVPELGNRTPLEVAKKPNIDAMTAAGRLGLVRTIPGGMSPASDIANLSLIGYDPLKYYSGRGPLEAANMGIELHDTDVAFRCNLVTIDNNVMQDYSAGHITSKEAKMLIAALDEKIGSRSVTFYPGVSYRHLTVVRAKDEKQKRDLVETVCTPPHNISGQPIGKYLPAGRADKFLMRLMEDSRKVLDEHEANKVRIDLKENPANMIWLWGQGVKPQMPLFADLFGLQGSIISAVDLVNGIGRVIGLEPVAVPGATGYYDTNYEGKAQYAIEALKRKDFVFVHVEAPDEAGHNGDIREKIKAIENFDRYIVGAFLERFQGRDDFRLMVLPDHPTPVALRTHTADPVPFVMCGGGIAGNRGESFSEKNAESTGLFISSGHDLVEQFIKG